VSAAVYAPHGGLNDLHLGNGLWEQTRYNKRLQPVSMGLGQTQSTDYETDLSTTNANLMLLNFGYGAALNNGNLLSQEIYRGPYSTYPANTLTQTYGYDGLNRLKTASETSGGAATWSPIIYGMDRYGNRWVTTGFVQQSDLTPSAQSHFDAATNRMQTSLGWQYDAAGNVTRDPQNNLMVYDAENRMKQFTSSTGTVTTYAYDGEGRRVKKVVGTTATFYVYNASGQLIAEYGGNGSSTGGTQYVTADHLGSTRVVTNASGAEVKRYDYLPYGEEILMRGVNYGSRFSYSHPLYNLAGDLATDRTHQKFTAKERDNESGLDFFGARYFSGAQGRFTSADEPLADQHPADPQSWNLFAYVRNNPLKNTDPNGKGCQHGLTNCVDYFIGGLKAIGNIPSGIINTPNHITNALLSPFTSFRFDDVVPQTFTPSNVDQQEGIGAANAMMVVAPVAEAVAGKIAEATTIGEAASKGGVVESKSLINGTNESGQLTSRSSLRQGTVQDAWDNAASGSNSGRLCPTCGKEVKVDPRSGEARDWDVDHQPKWTDRQFSPDTTRPQVIDNYQQGTRLRCPSCNRSDNQ
jgi:RHS repeat-associated protein